MPKLYHFNDIKKLIVLANNRWLNRGFGVRANNKINRVALK